MKLHVIMLNTHRTYYAIVYENEHVPYGRRHVEVELTPEQVKALTPRVVGQNGSVNVCEEIGEVFLEPRAPRSGRRAMVKTCDTCVHNGIGSMECTVCAKFGDTRSRWQPRWGPDTPPVPKAPAAATELQGQFDRAIAQRDSLARDLRAAREVVKTLGKCRRCDGTGKTRGICKDPRCGEPGWDHYCGEDEKVSCPDCDGTGMLAAARAILDQKQ